MTPHRSSARPAARLACALLCTLAALGHAPAEAWSLRGHAVVGAIAARLLTPAATAAVAALLVGDLGADGRPSGRTTLAAVANWADEVRATPEQRATGVYHYDDIPICAVADRATYCANGQCGTAWFATQLAILQNRSQPQRARNEALKWIVHLVGDLHQPLHASNHDDKGGNDVRVTWFGKRTDDPVDGRTGSPYNLHGAWDRLIPSRAIDAAGGDDRFVADLPTPATRRAWEVGAIDAWTMESFVLARDFVYPALPTGFACEAPIGAVVVLDAPYDAPAEAIAAAQLRKAGVRLAKVLDDALEAR